MRDLKEKGRVIGIDFLRRGKREKDEEVLWWRFWNSGKMYKDLLQIKRPETAAAMKEKEDLLKKKNEERKKLEDDLDARGRWTWDCGEYYWTIPDENGRLKSLAEFEDEWEANEPKLSSEEIAEKKRKEREEWRKHDEQLDRWAEQERAEKKAEQARKAREKRKEKKEQLLKPIDVPKQLEKGEYEKARDQTILERHNAMKDSGMFNDKELLYMLNMIN